MSFSRDHDTPLKGLHCTPRDSVDALLASWRSRRPDLDFSPLAVISRLGRLRDHIDAELDDVFAVHGLTAPGFAVLVTLARIDGGGGGGGGDGSGGDDVGGGGGGGVSQRRLMDELGLTSGTISVRMDRLVRQGLVDRRPDPASARNTLISLTEHGRELFERAVPAHLANERRLLSGLSPDERGLLADLLRKLLVEFEGSRPPDEGDFGLGLTLAPAHVADTLREAVGLPPVTGLLIRRVVDGGPAQAADLRTGDVLIAAGQRELRSVADLYAAIHDAAGAAPVGPLRLHLIRGAEQVRARLNLGAAAAADGTLATTAGRSASGEHRL